MIALVPEEPDKGSKVAEDKSSDQKVSKKSQDGGQPADNEELKVSEVNDQKEVKQDNLTWIFFEPDNKTEFERVPFLARAHSGVGADRRRGFSCKWHVGVLAPL